MYDGDSRIATAVELRTTEIYQVYPEKRVFSTLDGWKGSWGDGYSRVVETVTSPKMKKIPSVAERRRAFEYSQFHDPAYSWLIKHAEQGDNHDMKITLHDDTVYMITRPLDYLCQPIIMKDGVKVLTNDAQYSPAYTSIVWLMGHLDY
jgi:hypothetical protein